MRLRQHAATQRSKKIVAGQFQPQIDLARAIQLQHHFPRLSKAGFKGGIHVGQPPARRAVGFDNQRLTAAVEQHHHLVFRYPFRYHAPYVHPRAVPQFAPAFTEAKHVRLSLMALGKRHRFWRDKALDR